MPQPAVTSRTPGFTDYAILTGLAIVFGSSFLFTRIAVAEVPPVTLVAGRLLLAFVLLYPIMRAAAQRMPPIGTIWIPICGSAFFGNALPFFLISWGQVRVEAGLTAIFMAIMPLATVALAHMVTDDEKLNRWKMLGVFAGLFGVVILIGPGSLSALGDDTVRQLAILGGAVCYAVNALITRKLVHLPRRSMIVALMFAASVMMVPLSLLLEQPWQLSPSLPANLSVLVLAIGPTALATLIILVIIDRQGASFLSQINFMVPVAGMIFGALFLGERFPPNAYMALVVILMGVALSRWGTRRAA